MNAWFPMPYEKGCLLTVENDSPNDSILYFYIDYEEYADASAVSIDKTGRFHANWRRELLFKSSEETITAEDGRTVRVNNTGENNFLVLDAAGKGHYVGCFLHLDTNETGWWGEGDDMIFIDGEPWPPRLHGTGTEDYFCGAWNYNHLRQTYSTPYFGYYFKGNADYTGKHSQYRFHIEDPVYFEKSIRVTIEHGHANDRQGDWSSTAFWYQNGRTEKLPGLPAFDARVPYAFGGYEVQGINRAALPVNA